MNIALAIIIEIVTIIIWFVVALGNPTAPDPKRDPSPWPFLIIGTLIAAAVAFV